MNSNRGLIPQSRRQRPSLLSSPTSLWEDLEDRMLQLFEGTSDTGVTVSEDNQNVDIEANLPGLNPEDLDISLDRNTLRIKGEKREEQQDQNKRFYRRAQRSFYYQVELPSPVQEDSEQAHYENGVLRITFKKAQKDNVKKIALKKGSNQQSKQQISNQSSQQQQNQQQGQQPQGQSTQRSQNQRKK